MKPFTKRTITVIKSIPQGKVMTYGQVAKAAGSPRGARQVARILHSMSKKYDLPWHRVINAKGEIAIKDDETKMLQRWSLEEEGIVISEANGIDLRRYQYHSDAYDWENE